MSQGLLQGNARNVSEPPCLFLLFQLCQGGTQVIVVQAPLLLIVRIGTQALAPIVHIATTPKGLGKDAPLSISRVKPIFVGSLLFHKLQYSNYLVSRQEGPLSVTLIKKQPSLFRAKARVFTRPG